MSPQPPAFHKDDTIAGVAPALAEAESRLGASIYVIDEKGAPLGSVALARVLNAPRDIALQRIMEPLRAAAPEGLDQERVAALAAEHDLGEVPVVDANGRLIGVVAGPTMIRVVRHEHAEDLHKLAGIIHQANYAAHALEISPWRRVRDRLPWLMVGLIGSAAAAFVMAGYEAALSTNVAIAFFVPGIVYLADAIGTQTEAVAVRGLSATHVPLHEILVREMSAGLLIGLILAMVAGPVIAVWFADMRLALAVALSIVAAGGVATGIGLLLPWILSHLGSDPAFGSGPLATVIQDVLSLLVYLGLVMLIVPIG
jgi:magnesium transporter